MPARILPRAGPACRGRSRAPGLCASWARGVSAGRGAVGWSRVQGINECHEPRDRCARDKAAKERATKEKAKKEKGRRSRDVLSSHFRGKTEAHPNPVRIRMLSSAIVKRNRYRSRSQPLDLSGALLGSWPLAIAFRHVRSPASFRSAPVLFWRQLALSQIVANARRFTACPLYTAMPVPCLRTIFRPSVQRRTAQVRPIRKKLTFVSFYRSASERCIRLAYVSVPPIQPASRQALRIVDRAAKQGQDTKYLTFVESFFSTIFRATMCGKVCRVISVACQFFRKITERLFAGISTTSSSAREFFCAKGVISRSRSRTPQVTLRDFKLASKASLEGAL